MWQPASALDVYVYFIVIHGVASRSWSRLSSRKTMRSIRSHLTVLCTKLTNLTIIFFINYPTFSTLNQPNFLRFHFSRVTPRYLPSWLFTLLVDLQHQNHLH